MLRILNLLVVVGVLGNAFYLINQRTQARGAYMELSSLQNNADSLNKEYTRLQLEEGTYSSDLAVQGYASHNLGLIQPNKQQISNLLVELK